MAPLQPLIWDDFYVPPEFQNTPPIIEMHNIIRVTGQTEVAAMFGGNPQEKSDYLTGIIVFTACTFSIFVIWAVLLFVLRHYGNKRVGFWSGRLRKKPTPPSTYKAIQIFQQELQLEEEQSVDVTDVGNTENKQGESNLEHPSDFPASQPNPSDHKDCEEIVDESTNLRRQSVIDTYGTTVDDSKEWEEYLNEVKRIDRVLLVTRVCVILCAIGIIISSSFFINEGVVKLGSTLNAGIQGMWQANRVAQSGIDVIHIFKQEWVNITRGVSTLNESVSIYGWCPLKRDELIEVCNSSGIENVSIATLNLDCNITDIPFQQVMVALLDIFVGISVGLQQELDAIQSDLLDAQDIIQSMIRTSESFYWAFYVSAGFAVLVDIVVLILLFGVYLAWRKKLNKPFIRMRCCVIIPLFILFVFLMWLFAIIFCFTAILAADFCYDGPEATLNDILNKHRNLFSSAIFRVIEFYLTKCREPKLSAFEAKTLNVIVKGINLVHDLSFDLSQVNQTTFFEVCGIDISPLSAVTEYVHEQMHIVADSVVRVQEIFLCSNIFPLIEIILYDAVCYLGAGALRNVYFALLLTVTFSLTFITLRVAWQDDIDPCDEVVQTTSCCSCCYRKARNDDVAVNDNVNTIGVRSDTETLDVVVAPVKQLMP